MKMLDSGDVADHPYQTQFQAFFDALDAGKDMPLTSFADALRDAPRHRRRGQVRRPRSTRRSNDDRDSPRRRTSSRSHACPPLSPSPRIPTTSSSSWPARCCCCGEAGWEIHYLNLSTGNLGSTTMSAGARPRGCGARKRRPPRRCSAPPGMRRSATISRSSTTRRTLRRLCAVIREVAPDVILTHSPQDYMEDHMNTCRLAVYGGVRARRCPDYRHDAAANGRCTSR